MYDKTTIMQIAIIVIGIVITLYLGIKEKRKNEENINKLVTEKFIYIHIYSRLFSRLIFLCIYNIKINLHKIRCL